MVFSRSGRDSALFKLLYNDEHPDGNTSFTAGHTKGVVALGDRRGFWLVHSVPKFPPEAGKYGYPRTGHMYGQTFLCITLETAANADALGVQVGDAMEWKILVLFLGKLLQR